MENAVARALEVGMPVEAVTLRMAPGTGRAVPPTPAFLSRVTGTEGTGADLPLKVSQF